MILLVGTGLFALSDILSPEGVLRRITDILMVVLMFGAMGAWVHTNRPALARIDESERGGSSVEIRYVASERHPLWPAKTKGYRRERARLKNARQASPGAERR